MAGRELRRTLTISDQLSESKAGRGDDDAADPDADASVPELQSLLSAHKRGPPARSIAGAGASSGKTLFDIIREEQEATGAGIDWKSFQDGLRLRRAGAAFTSASADHDHDGGGASSYATPSSSSSSSSAAAMLSRSVASRNSDALSNTTDIAGATPAAPPAAEEPVRMSLMALLEQTAEGYGDDDDEDDDNDEEAAAAAAEEEEGEEEEEEEGNGGMYYVCCVCMVRHKGAAFIPCGHTFCRLCSRELWVSRGNCPLCNGFILEILDIF